MPLRSAPYLWVQLINGGALPLETLLLLLLLAGADPGPLPLLERLLAWGLGAAAPALLLWQRPADPRSLLLLRCTSADPGDPSPFPDGGRPMGAPQVVFAVGVVLLLPLLSWLDRTAALADQLSPLQGADRLVCLIASAVLLALMVWQWQQLVQAIWLLAGDQAAASGPAGAITRNPGLPWLRLPALDWPSSHAINSHPLDSPSRASEDDLSHEHLGQAPESDSGAAAAAETEEEQPDVEPGNRGMGLAEQPEASGQAEDAEQAKGVGQTEGVGPELTNPEAKTTAEEFEAFDSAAALAVEPELASENGKSADLDQQIP